METEETKPRRTIRIRRHHSAETWAQARRDYLAGFTASEVSKNYGMSVDAIRKRASKQKWRKAHHLAEPPAPLLPFPPAEEVEESGNKRGVSAWDRIAHDAQRAPEAPWSTWLFQGGRGAGKTRAGAEWPALRAHGAIVKD